MVKDTIIDAIKFLGESMKEYGLNISKIILFGSQIEDKATEESDIDLVIISDDFKDKDIFERAKLTRDAEIMTIKKFLVPFDIISMTPAEYEHETSIVAQFAKKGMIMYAAQ